jgi:hypothetical protein
MVVLGGLLYQSVRSSDWERVCAANEWDQAVSIGGDECGDAGRCRELFRDGAGASG